MAIESSQENNKRIAKNTLLLYFRMLLTMVVSLYTSRVVLGALGVEDYGIYNVVGGVVAMFSMLSGSLSAAISRFITFELGTGNKEKLKSVFSSSVTIQMGLSAIILVLAETVGLWFLNNKMVIPDSRMYAANWVFQLSVLTFVINLISIPYNAAIIAHERMSAFAYISIFEAVSKLVVAYCIVISPIDRLILYAIMLTTIAIIIRLIYGSYCKRKFVECTYHFIYDHDLLKQMFGFAGWNFIGSIGAVLREHGGNIILNLFFGPAVNAARGIAVQINAAIIGFVNNFMTALNPQITKSYAENNISYTINLVKQGARISFYILYLIALPIMINIEYVLQIWLGKYPEYTADFVRLVLIFALSECLSHSIITAMLATGKIKYFQLTAGALQLLNLPISFTLLWLDFPPTSIFVVSILLSQIGLWIRLVMLRHETGISLYDFFTHVFCNVLMVSVVSAILPLYLNQYIVVNFMSFLLISILSILYTLFIIFIIGCNKQERSFIYKKIKKHKFLSWKNPS